MARSWKANFIASQCPVNGRSHGRRMGRIDDANAKGSSLSFGGYTRAMANEDRIAAASAVWLNTLLRVWAQMTRHHMPIIAAGVAFFAFLAIPSALTALVALYGLISNPRVVQHQIAAMNGVLPAEVVGFVSFQLRRIILHSHLTLGTRFAVALAVAFLAARASVVTMLGALHIAHRRRRRQGFLAHQLAMLGLTTAAILFVIASLALVAGVPAVVHLLPLGRLGRTVAAVARWPLVLLLMLAALELLYRAAPPHVRPPGQWLSWGAIAAALVWIGGSVLFSLYVRVAASYSETSGALGGVVVLMIWLYVAALAALFGAELNVELGRLARGASPPADSAPAPAPP
jgi:membrane protein